ncbi:MAG TPA: glycoside hydrolase domain-containing protein, partial [Ktedonobacteraceae bacterium]|nr:glycoside hydrolase domain-containing protein [Ktedonobacteraceae bacterium]
AQALGDNSDYQKFLTRAQDWENLYNPADGYLEPRNLDGSFASPYNPSSGSGWVESNGAQYEWMIPFNLGGLFAASGGNTKVNQRLDSFFTQLNAGPGMPYAFLGNEPTIETPWEYDYAGSPYKTQKVVREAVNTLWMPGPEGLPGNDDLGTMSSWYVFAAIGMFPETPGNATLVLDSPLFPTITLHRPGGQTIQINAPGASASTYYIQSLKVNGQSSTKPWLPPSFVQTGGTLDFTLSGSPNTTWGAAATDAPPSFQYGEVPTLVSFNPSRAVVVPGKTTQTSIFAENIGSSASSVSWTATAPSGLTITPTSGSFTVPAGSTGSQPLTVTAAANTGEGYYRISFSAQNSSGTTLPPLTMLVVVAQSGSLLPFYDNVGISNDNSSSAADYDGDGFSYSAQQLSQIGYTPGATVTVNGISYTWPNVAAGSYDNIEASGQTIPLPNAKTGATQLTFLGSATNGPSDGTVTITYTDGSSTTAQLGFSDWTLNAGSSSPSYNNVVAAKTAYRNSSGGSPDTTTTYLFATAAISLDSTKQVASVTLPSSVNSGTLHIFAVAVS